MQQGMGELIELVFKAVVWLVVASAYLPWHIVRLVALAGVYATGSRPDWEARSS